MTGQLGVAVIVVLLAAAGAQTLSAQTPPAAPGGAERYYDWLTGCLGGIEKDLPAYTRSAEAAAKLYVQDGCEIGAFGDDPFVRELYNRSGGLMQMKSFGPLFQKKGTEWAPPAKGVALVGLRDDMLDDCVGKILEFRKRNYYVAVFGRTELIEKAKKVLPNGADPDAWFDVHASAHGGLVQNPDGQWIIPTDSATLSSAGWVWTAEFVAACTREGKMPPMYLGYAIEGAGPREAKFKGVKFHDTLPARLEAGALSRQWLTELRASLQQIHASEMPGIRKAASDAAAAKAAGGKLWVYLQGHEIIRLMGYPHDPKWFEPLHRDWNTLRKDAKAGAGDFVLCIGYDQIFDGKDWQDFASEARKAGAKLAWSFTDYRPEQVKTVPTGETFIDQHWAKGDAAAAIPNYDIKCLPTSGVIAEAVLWMVHAEMAGKLNAAQ